jgi:hypothetical protein
MLGTLEMVPCTNNPGRTISETFGRPEYSSADSYIELSSWTDSTFNDSLTGINQWYNYQIILTPQGISNKIKVCFWKDGDSIPRTPSFNASDNSQLSTNQYVFKVLGNRFVLPRDLVGKVKWLTVWDLRGKRVGRVEVENERVVELRELAKERGIVFGSFAK